MDKRVIIIILLIGILTTGSCVFQEEAGGELNKELIRLHVLANSDSERDQYLKYQVRDAIIKEFADEFSRSQDIEMTREMLIQNLNLVEKVARDTLQRLNCDYTVEAQYGHFSFPTKFYGNFTLPAGEYEAVKVVIGQGKGANWWCVLFPPLCFVETKEESHKVENGYPVNSPAESQPKKIRISFKLWEWLHRSFVMIASLFS